MQELDCEEGWAPKNWCFWTVVLEKTLEIPLDCKEIQPIHSRGDQPWVFFGRNDAEAETPVLWPPHAKLTHWKRLCCWEGLGAGGEGDDRGWDGWMASPTRWTWVWVNSRRWWWTGRPGVLQFTGSQRVGHDWVTELNWTDKYGADDVWLGLPLWLSNAGDLGSIPGLGRSPEEWKGYPLQYSGLENSTDCKVHGVTELDMTERFSLSLSYIVHIMYDKAHESIHFD